MTSHDPKAERELLSPGMSEKLSQFKGVCEKLTRSKTTFEIRHFVIGQHESRYRQWRQIQMEADQKIHALEEAQANVSLAQVDLEELEYKVANMLGGDFEVSRNKIRIQQKKNQLKRSEFSMTGCLKELTDYMQIAETEFADFFDKSEEELASKYDEAYWLDRLSRQAQFDLVTQGKIGAGNMGAISQVPEKLQELILAFSVLKAKEFNQSFEKALEAKPSPQLREIGDT